MSEGHADRRADALAQRQAAAACDLPLVMIGKWTQPLAPIAAQQDGVVMEALQAASGAMRHLLQLRHYREQLRRPSGRSSHATSTDKDPCRDQPPIRSTA